MKRIALVLALCIVLCPLCAAETSHADEFMSNLSRTWDSFLDMASDAEQAVSDWADDSGVTEWAQGAVEDISDWAEESGLTDWARGALQDITDWYDGSGIREWTQGAAADLQTFIDENGPTIEAWLAGAGEEVRHAWNTLIHPDRHTEEEIRAAYETVTESLSEAGSDPTDDEGRGE